MVYVGDRLGLYRALVDRGPATAEELADATGTNARYVREWLEQQAVTGILEVDAERRYSLPEADREVFVDPDSLEYMAAFVRMMVGMARPLPQVLEAFRSGGGVPYADFDADFVEGQGDTNRVQFVNLLGQEWLPALPDVDARLRADPPARVADVACGVGWSTISIARAYPNARVEGFDLDEESIRLARENLDGGRARRPGHVRGPRRGRARRRELRPDHGLRSGARPLAPGRGPERPARGARRGRHAADRRRARRGGLRRAGRRARARLLRLERAPLPPRRHGRAAVRRHGHRDAPGHAPPLRGGGRLRRRRGPPDRQRLLALLPAAGRRRGGSGARGRPPASSSPRPRERRQRGDRAPGVRGAREEEQVGAGADRLPRPALDRRRADDRERVGDRDAVEPERAQALVRLAARSRRGSGRRRRTRGSSSRSGRPSGSRRGRARASAPRIRASTWGRSSVETAAVPSPGKCLTQAASPSPRANATPSSGPAEVPRAERAAQVEHGREVDVDAAAAERAPRRPAGGEGVGGRAVRARGPPRAARRGNARTSPPSWSTKTSAPFGLRRRRVPAPDEHPADAARRRQPGDDDERGLLAAASAQRRPARRRETRPWPQAIAPGGRSRLTCGVAVAAPAPTTERRSLRWLALPLVLFALIALTVGVVAREAGGPRGRYFDLFFSDTIHMKAWLASAALAFGVLQLFTAAWIYGKLPWRKPPWVNPVHRWSGPARLRADAPGRVPLRLPARLPDAARPARTRTRCSGARSSAPTRRR